MVRPHWTGSAKWRPRVFGAVMVCAFNCGLASGVFAQPSPPPIATQHIADAKPGEVRVLASGAVQGPLDKSRAQAEAAVGKTLVIEYGAARVGLKNQILSGVRFEVAVLSPDVSQQLQDAGKLLPQVYPLGVLPIAVGLRGDRPPALDISTPEGLKAAVLGAKTIRYGATGLGFPTVQKMAVGLGLQNKIGDGAQGQAPAPLKPGEYELSFFPRSEIRNNKDLQDLGAVSAPFQAPLQMEARVSTSAADPTAAKALAAFLAGAQMAVFLRPAGYESAVATPPSHTNEKE